MKRIIQISVVIALILLGIPAILLAGPVAPTCPVQSEKCFQREGDLYCGVHENVGKNTLVRGRAGQLDWVRVQTSEFKLEKCS